MTGPGGGGPYDLARQVAEAAADTSHIDMVTRAHVRTVLLGSPPPFLDELVGGEWAGRAEAARQRVAQAALERLRAAGPDRDGR